MRHVKHRGLPVPNASLYIRNLDYGAGIPALVGQPANAPAITGRIRGQMLLEAAVARTPRPSAMVSAATDRTVFAAVRCANATTVPTDPGIPEFKKSAHW